MKTISTTDARKIFGKLVEEVKTTGKSFIFGKRNVPEAVLIPYPKEFNPTLSEITNINTYSTSFDFLKNEPELYSPKDIKKFYA